jgi:hypothetical protein
MGSPRYDWNVTLDNLNNMAQCWWHQGRTRCRRRRGPSRSAGLATYLSSTLPPRFNEASQYDCVMRARPIWCLDDPAYVWPYSPELVYSTECQAPIRIRNCHFRTTSARLPAARQTPRPLKCFIVSCLPRAQYKQSLVPPCQANGRGALHHAFDRLWQVSAFQHTSWPSYRGRSSSPD